MLAIRWRDLRSTFFSYRKIGVDYNLCETAFNSLPEDDKKYYEVVEYVGADPVPWVGTVDNPSFVVEPGVRDIIEELNLINAQREVRTATSTPGFDYFSHMSRSCAPSTNTHTPWGVRCLAPMHFGWVFF